MFAQNFLHNFLLQAKKKFVFIGKENFRFLFRCKNEIYSWISLPKKNNKSKRRDLCL